MRRSHIAAVLFLGIFLNHQTGHSQSSNSTGTLKWPANPPVGIGTQLDPPFAPQNALHIHYNPSDTGTRPAMLRLSEGDSANMQYFGLLGLMPLGTTTYSSLSTGDDLILHEHQGGDIIITNFSTPTAAFAHGTAIRLATTSDSAHRPLLPLTPHDLERMTITGNGNIGFDLPPDSTTGLGNPMEQVQIGGGVLPEDSLPYAVPGLTFYGGNRFEGMPKPGGGLFPFDWRYIGFNFWIDHTDPSSLRGHRLANMGSSAISFAGGTGGMVDLRAFPYDSARIPDSLTHGIEFHLTGTNGLEFWSDEGPSDRYHHLFEIWRPGFQGNGVVRNVTGITMFHTPMLITSEQIGYDFTDFAHVRPDIGDGLTWTLAVDGPMLAKEVFVLDSTWADYVFDPGYKLPPLGEIEKFVKANRHLPGIEPASKIKETGVPLGRTEGAITKQLEDELLYIEQLSHKIDALEAEVQGLKNQKGK